MALGVRCAAVLAAGVILAGCAARTQAGSANALRYAGDVPLTLVNDSAQVACYVLMSPSTEGDWGDDWLGSSESIAAGAERTFEVGSSPGWDVKVQNCRRETIRERRGIVVSVPLRLRISDLGAEPGSGATAVASAPSDSTSDGPRYADYRLGDRFWFAPHGGVVLASATNAAGARQTSEAGPAFGWETSFWPNDFFGLGIELDVLFATLPSPELATYSTHAGLFAVAGVPLRWVQPYGGAFAAVRTTSADDRSTGMRLELQPLVGLNVYLGRDTRFFAQWRWARLDFDEAAGLGYTDAGAHLVMGGLRVSPAAFHEARDITRFNLIWWSTLVSVATWLTVTIIGS